VLNRRKIYYYLKGIDTTGAVFAAFYMLRQHPGISDNFSIFLRKFVIMSSNRYQTMLLESVSTWNQWREEQSMIPINLNGIYLRGVDLTQVNLGKVDLLKASLRSANLHKANLNSSNLRGADLGGAKLTEASLHKANLSKTDLHKANLSGANLCEADLSGANLSEANLNKASLHTTNLYMANLSRVNLCEADLSGADLRKVQLAHSMLSEANLCGANLNEAILYKADLSKANLNSSDLRGTELRETNLSGASLRGVKLNGANLSGFDLCGVDLNGANLSGVQALKTNFAEAILTAVCIEDWNINSATNLEGVICEYVYLKHDCQQRRPRTGYFKPGEFAALFQTALDTVDLIFKDGIDWQAFFSSFQELRNQYDGQDISIQAIEKKRGDAFVVRLEVSPESNKSVVESYIKALYETKMNLIEERYRSELKAKEGEIAIYKQQSVDLVRIAEILASKPMNSEISQNFHGPVGNVAANNQGEQKNIQHNYAAVKTTLSEVASELQALLRQLEEYNPEVTDAEKTAYLSTLIPPTRRQRFISAVQSAGSAALEEIPYGVILKATIDGWMNPD